MPTRHVDLKALKRLIKELEKVIKIGPIPSGIAARSQELFMSIHALVDDLIERTPARELGTLGGRKTAERGPEYFKHISGMRKTNAGGRPKKKNQTVLSEGADLKNVRSRVAFIIAKRANELGLDLEGISKVIGSSDQYTRDLLQGKKIPSDEKLEEIIKGLSLDDFQAQKVRVMVAEDRRKHDGRYVSL